MWLCDIKYRIVGRIEYNNPVYVSTVVSLRPCVRPLLFCDLRKKTLLNEENLRMTSWFEFCVESDWLLLK